MASYVIFHALQITPHADTTTSDVCIVKLLNQFVYFVSTTYVFILTFFLVTSS
jgi:hypothetical protein